MKKERFVPAKRQAIDGRYNIPYNHPLNDYVALVGGYEREERDDVAQGSGLLIESAVAGVDGLDGCHLKYPMPHLSELDQLEMPNAHPSLRYIRCHY